MDTPEPGSASSTTLCFICQQSTPVQPVRLNSTASLVSFTLEILGTHTADTTTQGKRFCSRCLFKVEAAWNAYSEYNRLKSDVQQLYRPMHAENNRKNDPGSSKNADLESPKEQDMHFTESTETPSETESTLREIIETDIFTPQIQIQEMQDLSNTQEGEDQEVPMETMDLNTPKQSFEIGENQKGDETMDSENQVEAIDEETKHTIEKEEGNMLTQEENQEQPFSGVKCEYCEEVLEDQGKFSKHLKQHPEAHKHECQKCGKKFLKEHMLQQHTNPCSLTCILCKTRFRNKNIFDAHMENCAKNKGEVPTIGFLCSVCGVSFESELQVREHRFTHLPPSEAATAKAKSYFRFCRFCPLGFDKYNKLQRHRKMEHRSEYLPGGSPKNDTQGTKHGKQDGKQKKSKDEAFDINVKLNCEICNYVGGTRKDLNQHMDIHKIKKPFICTECGRAFPRKTHLVTHEVTHTQQKDHECLECGKKFGQKSNLLRHQRTHTEQKDHLCTVCGQAFQRGTELATHMLKHTGETPFVCEVCEKSFSSEQALQTHLKTHNGEASHQCDVCGKTFNQLSGYIVHSRQHTGERPFKCVTCNAKFALGDSYKAHIRIHTGDKPYKCKRCNAVFRTNPNLQSHMKTHDGEKKYICDHCDTRFSQKCSLSRHLQQHSVPRPHKCDQCDSAYTRSEYLKRHKNHHHGESIPKPGPVDEKTSAANSAHPISLSSDLCQGSTSTVVQPSDNPISEKSAT